DPMRASLLPQRNIDPTGITGTPVIDVTTGTIFVVGFLQPGQHELFAVDLNSGMVLYHRVIDPSGSNPLVQQQRPALSLSKGIVYISYGGLYGDCGNYHGWVVGAYANDSGSLLSYQVPTGREGGIWAPSGPSIDSNGDL